MFPKPNLGIEPTGKIEREPYQSVMRPLIDELKELDVRDPDQIAPNDPLIVQQASQLVIECVNTPISK